MRTFRLAALVIAGIALSLAVLRLCMVICHRPSRVQRSRHAMPSRPQVAIVESHYVKPDLPPAYRDAVAQEEIDESKLPSYDEVRDEQMSSRV